jgi:hypothetical protein
MANNCYIDLYITTRTKWEAEKIGDILAKNIQEANKKNEGAFIGSNTRYIFDAGVINHTPVTVKVEGWVKWSISNTEIKDIIDWINAFVSVTKINMRYEETGMYLYGEYIYNKTGRKGKQLCDKYVEEKDFPTDFNDENYYEDLEQIFQKKAVKKYIPFH